MILLSISLITLLLYCILVILFIKGWEKNNFYTPLKIGLNYPKLSIIIACKNEASHLPQLLKSLSKQSFQDFELILIDDHSSDDTAAIMQSGTSELQDVKILKAKAIGKKMAIQQGILAAKGELIITTDADCTMDGDWLMTIASFYCQHPCDLIIGPVQIETHETLFSKLQALEFATLVASGAGAAGVNAPILCNAANLTFTKIAWLESQKELREDLISGDDIFLLQSIKKRAGKIQFLKSTAAMVYTQPARNLQEFISQRQRWASKAPAYTDWMLIFTSCIILSINVSILSSSLAAFYAPSYLKISIAVISIKYCIDLFFISCFKSFFSLQNSLYLSIVLTIVYPFYIVYIASSSVILKQKW